MGKKEEKKEEPITPLPLTKVETAEQRLEELVTNESITRYQILHNQTWAEMYVKNGKARVYPDGFEAVIGPQEAVLHVERRNAFIFYNLEKEHKK
ncbi:hypothetical protein FJZ53_07250 [Candidatus Woesearchaeota archaeon]|nr:hypothetical protein [Candidatus Woesearchaeota archaeon]